VKRRQGRVSPLNLRVDAGFANPDLYERLEAERIKYAIRPPTNRVAPLAMSNPIAPIFTWTVPP
jgi:hypothetical protein